jgi:hypothetical protein
MRPLRSGALADSPDGTAMNECLLHALNPTPGRLFDGVEQVRMSPLCIEHGRQLSNVDAAYMVADDSRRRPNLSALRIAVRRVMPGLQSWRSTAIVEWSHNAGVEHLPAIFGGAAVEHINRSAREAGVNLELAGVR